MRPQPKYSEGTKPYGGEILWVSEVCLETWIPGGGNGTDRTKRTYGIERIDTIEGIERIETRGRSVQTTCLGVNMRGEDWGLRAEHTLTGHTCLFSGMNLR